MPIFSNQPSVPQPSAGQSGEFINCQDPDPVIESGAQVLSASHRPQQQLMIKGESFETPPSPSS